MISRKNKQKTGLRYPPINNMIDKAENKYELVLATAKRAREIVAGEEPLVKIDINNPVSIATKELDEEMVKVISWKEDDIVMKDDFPEESELTENAPTIADIAQSMIIED